MKEVFGTRRIGILGGTFNPVHHGHLLLAQAALEVCNLEELWFVPCNRPPHKTCRPLAPAKDRLAMLKAATKGNPSFSVCDVELRRGGVSYAVDTMRALCGRNPDTEFRFIVGADALEELHRWRNITEILRLCTLVVFARPGMRIVRPRLPSPWPARVLTNLHTGRLVDISSSEIRNRVACGASIRYLVPASVETYIRTHRLYAKSGRKQHG